MEQPKELNLLNIFTGTEYIVPIYQRSYAWEKEEIEQLLNDIFDFTDSNDEESKYYLGSLIVDDLGNNQFSVIDGQQRLTTLFLLFTYLKKMNKELGLSEKSLGFEAREKSNKTLNALFLGKREEISSSLYAGELTNGYDIISDYFEEKIKKTKNKNLIESFINVFDKIHIIRTQVPKDIDLNHYFEIMNTRGEQLEIHEIAKGKLIAKISDLNKRKIASMIWDNCSQMDRYIQMTFKPIKLRDSIFGTDWDTFEGYGKFEDIFNKVIQFNNSEEENIDEFSLRDKLDNPERVDETSASSEDENLRFESIISFPNFLLVVNEALNLNETNKEEDDSTLDDKKFLKTLEHHWATEESALAYIFNLLKYKFIFDTTIIKREYAKDHKEEGKWTLTKLISKKDDSQIKPYYDTPAFTENQKEILTLQSALRVTYTSPKTMHWISKALNNTNTILSELERYSCEKLKKASYHLASGFGFDRIVFTYLDYILYRDFEKLPFLKDQKLDAYQFMFRTSIEHFHPQHPLNGESWIDLPDDPLNNFGNLALITVSANSKFTNLNPSSKIKEHNEIITQSPKLMRMKELMLTGDDGWTTEKVKTHCKEMFDLLDAEIKKYGL